MLSTSGLVIAVAAAVAVGACSGQPDPGPVCREYVAGDVPTESVSFEQDVLPIFQRSCGLNALCHGLPTNLPFLGSNPPAPGDAAAVWASIVNRPAGALPSRMFVEPGDPANSFLMRKMDGDQCIWDAECKAGSCGAPMPEGLGLLQESDRDLVRAWILQGAQE